MFAITGGLVTLFTFVAATWKLFRFIFKVDRAMPTLLNIAHQFENNKGSTIKDKIEKISERAEEIATIAETSHVVANTNAAIVNELSRTHTEELTHIREYLHTKMHDILGALTSTQLQAAMVDTRMTRIEERLDSILPYVVRQREDYTGEIGEGEDEHDRKQ